MFILIFQVLIKSLIEEVFKVNYDPLAIRRTRSIGAQNYFFSSMISLP